MKLILYVFLTGKNSIHLYLNGNSEPNLPEAIKKIVEADHKTSFFSVEVKSQHCLSFTTVGEETELMTFDIHCMEFSDFQN